MEGQPASIIEAPAPPPHPRSLVDVLAATVARHGPRPAIDTDGACLTYWELWDAASDLADRLRWLGIGVGDRVGVRVPSGTAELYIAILGVLVAGAAYVPVDADDPEARAAGIWRSAGACAVIEQGLAIRELAAGGGGGGGGYPAVDDDAWIIFTSGSTGAPKGVVVTHRSAAAFVDAEARLWTVDPDDRVLAGLSVGFDASCEEMWLAWRCGAALIPAPRAIARAGADFGAWLAERAVTVVSTVPTAAALWEDDALAGVRLLILGGEACPERLGWRLATDREVWNTYGPTEATVVSTAARIRPGEPVTIGRPLDGWQAAVVDEGGRPVPFGEPGELVIGGVGLGRYLDPALDRERYAGVPALAGARAYRSGDIVRETAAGLAFVGRRDDQVKLAGRRVELGEVEARLADAPGVRAAAAAVRETAGGNALLVGYVVGDIDAAEVRAAVAEWLPDGVVPLVVTVDALPIAASGKVDRKALPWPPPSPPAGAGVDRARRNGHESPLPTGTAAWLAERWADQLGPMPMTAGSDFFELGGNSVAAAKLVSALRARFPSAAVADVYRQRTLGELAARLDGLGDATRAIDAAPASGARRWGAVQLAGFLVLEAAKATQLMTGILAVNAAFDLWYGSPVGPEIGWGWLIAAWLLLASVPGRALIVVVARWIVLGRVRPGRYPRHGWLSCRLWFMERFAEVFRLDSLAGTPWAARYARLSGATVGTGVRLGTLPSATSLLTVGDGAAIEQHVDLHGWWIEGSELIIGEMRIGAGSRIGTRAVLMPGAVVGADAEVEPGSVVTTEVPAGERWCGSPAVYDGATQERWPAEPAPRPRRARLWQAMYGAGLAAQTALPVVAALPALVLLGVLVPEHHGLGAFVGAMLLYAPLLVLTSMVAYGLLAALLFRGASRLLRPGWHPDQGPTAWALWFTERLLDSAVAIMFPLYLSVYTRPWLRLLGLRVGKRTEMSHSSTLNRLATVGDAAFAADEPGFLVGRARRGWLHVAPIEVGGGTFLGNGAILRDGTKLGEANLLGVLTIAPLTSADGTSWFGSPPLELPRVPEATDRSRATHPPRRLVAARAVVELSRVLGPTSASIVMAVVAFAALDAIARATGPVWMVAAAPAVILVTGLCAVLLTIAAKWLVIGRYRAGQHAFWSLFVWRDEIINSCQEALARPWLLGAAMGTPLMPLYLRAMGAKVGKDVWFETLAVTEFDLVQLGDGAVVNRGAHVQTHLLHDRLLQLGPTTLRPGATLGPAAAVLPDTVLGEGCSVGARSVVLRGEQLPPRTRWHGAPLVAV